MADDIKTEWVKYRLLQGAGSRRFLRRRGAVRAVRASGSPRPASTSSTMPTPWRWQPSIRRACRTSASCCSRGSTSAGAADRGFVFYTNYEGAKGRELLASRKAALNFHWKSLRRQVRVRGDVSTVSAAEADAYFASRPRGSRIGAWASAQSRPLESRFALEKAVAPYTARYRDRRDPAAAALVGLPRHAARDRVLARPAVPAARAHRVPPRGRGPAMEQSTALPMIDRAAGQPSRGMVDRADDTSNGERRSPVPNSHPQANADRKTLILTGASRGIGHATVKRFSSAGWRVITCSRQPFPENCPWEMGPEDHIQVDLADPQDDAAGDRR